LSRETVGATSSPHIYKDFARTFAVWLELSLRKQGTECPQDAAKCDIMSDHAVAALRKRAASKSPGSLYRPARSPPLSIAPRRRGPSVDFSGYWQRHKTA
jgi:hypothetical protein